MSRVTDACDDLVTAINAASFTSITDTVTAVRAYMLPHDHHESRGLKVWIFPRSKETSIQTRASSTLEQHVVEVVARKPVSRNEKLQTTEIDNLIGFMDELQDLLLRADLATQGQKVVEVSQEEYLDTVELNAHHAFESTITLSIRDQF